MGIFLEYCQELYLEPNQKSMVALFCKNSYQLLAVNFFFEKSLHKRLTVFQSYMILHNFI